MEQKIEELEARIIKLEREKFFKGLKDLYALKEIRELPLAFCEEKLCELISYIEDQIENPGDGIED